MIPNWVRRRRASCRRRATTRGRASTGSPSASSSCTPATSATRRTSTRWSARRTFLRDLDDLAVLIIGGGARRAELVALARRLEADKVEFLPYQPHELRSQSLSTADVHVVGLARGLAGYVVPSRLYGILAAGRPVIAAADAESETAQLVARGRLRRRRPAGRPVRARARDPRRARRRVRPRGDGPAGARVRRVGGRPGDRGRPLPRRAPRARGGGVIVVEVVFWASLGALVWTHVALPARGGRRGARVRRRPVRARRRRLPTVTVIVAAYNEEAVIERRLENLLALDYPADRLEIVVASDASDDRTDELVEAVAAREPRVRLIRCPRGGKVAAQDRAVRETTGEIVAFSDANATWAPDALAQARPLVRRPRGRVRLRPARADRRRRDRTARASTGASRPGCARRSPRSARSPAATARSTPCAAPTTSRSTRASATTSRSRT